MTNIMKKIEEKRNNAQSEYDIIFGQINKKNAATLLNGIKSQKEAATKFFEVQIWDKIIIDIENLTKTQILEEINECYIQSAISDSGINNISDLEFARLAAYKRVARELKYIKFQFF